MATYPCTTCEADVDELADECPKCGALVRDWRPLPPATPLSITWRGYEFLDASRDSGLWSKAKKNVIGPAASVSFNVLLEWLKMEAKQRLGIDATGSSS